MDFDIKAVETAIETANKAIASEAKNAKDLAEKAMVEAKDLITKMEASEKASKDEIELLRKDFNDMSANFNSAKSKTESKGIDLAFEIKENKDAIRKIVKGNVGEIELKANTITASIATNEESFHLPTIGQLGVKATTLYDVLPKINMPAGNHSGTVSYVDWDESTTVKAAAAVAEGAAFPESTAKFKYYKEDLKKIGDILPVSEEFGEDEISAAAELSRFLTVNIGQEISRQLALGDGTSNQIRGLLNRATAYNPVGAGIVDANLNDLVRKMKTAMVKGRGSKYRPDIVVMNSETYDKYALKKDSQNRYLFDDTGRIAGLTVVEDNFIPDNRLVIGDRKYASIYQRGGVVLSEAYVGDQFGADLKSIKARTRLLMLIREVDRTGFLYCDDISADLLVLQQAATT